MQWDLGIDAGDEDIVKNSFIINAQIFFEVIFMHSFFLYLEYIFKWSYFTLITIQFVSTSLLHLIIGIYALNAYKEKYTNGK
jgi:hypothetical protein